MLDGMPLSGAAIICVTTACASCMRSTSFALSLAPKAADELIASATPQAITDKCFVFILFLFFVHGSGNSQVNRLFPIGYVMAGTKKALHEPTWVPPRQKNGGCREVPGSPGSLSTTPLPGLC